jgi:hypothetical protein
MESASNLWFVLELGVDGRRGVFYRIDERFLSLACLEGVASTEEVLGQKLIDGRGDRRLPVRVVTLVHSPQIKAKAETCAQSKRSASRNNPGPARTRVGNGTLRALCTGLHCIEFVLTCTSFLETGEAFG